MSKALKGRYGRFLNSINSSDTLSVNQVYSRNYWFLVFLLMSLLVFLAARRTTSVSIPASFIQAATSTFTRRRISSLVALRATTSKICPNASLEARTRPSWTTQMSWRILTTQSWARIAFINTALSRGRTTVILPLSSFRGVGTTTSRTRIRTFSYRETWTIFPSAIPMCTAILALTSPLSPSKGVLRTWIATSTTLATLTTSTNVIMSIPAIPIFTIAAWIPSTRIRLYRTSIPRRNIRLWKRTIRRIVSCLLSSMREGISIPTTTTPRPWKAKSILTASRSRTIHPSPTVAPNIANATRTFTLLSARIAQGTRIARILSSERIPFLSWITFMESIRPTPSTPFTYMSIMVSTHEVSIPYKSSRLPTEMKGDPSPRSTLQSSRTPLRPTSSDGTNGTKCRTCQDTRTSISIPWTASSISSFGKSIATPKGTAATI